MTPQDPSIVPKENHLQWATALGLGTLVTHALIAWWIPLPGVFRKYSVAVAHRLDGRLPDERLMDFSPFYLRLTEFFVRFVPSPDTALQGLQFLVVAAAAGLFYLLLVPRFGRGWATLGALVLAFDRHVLIYERILEPEVMLLFLLLAVLVLLTRPSPGCALAAGVAAGLALMTRPTFLPAFALVPLYFHWRSSAETVPWRRTVRHSVAFLAPVGLALILVALQTNMATGNPRTPVMNPGTVFFEGNNPVSHGTSAIYPPIVLNYVRNHGDIPDSAHEHYRTVARAAAGERSTVVEVNRFWSSKAMAFLRAEPGQALSRLREKLLRACHGFRWHDIPVAWQYDLRLPIPGISFAILATLALFGGVLEARRWRDSLLIYAVGLLQLSVMLVFYVSARQRIVLLLAVIYFALVALEALRRSGRRGILWGLLGAVMALSLLLPDDAMGDEAYQRLGFLETDRILSEIRQRSTEAPLAHHDELVVDAVAASPWWLDWLYPAYFPRAEQTLEQRAADALMQRSVPPAFGLSLAFDRADMLIRAGRYAEAEAQLAPLVDVDAQVYRGSRQTSEPLVLRARARALAGDRDDAVADLRRVLGKNPGEPFALAELVALADPATTDVTDAERRLMEWWGELDGSFLLGRTHLRYGQFQRAVDHLTPVVTRLEAFRDARIHLAAALAGLGRDDEAVRHVLEANRMRPEPILEAEAIVDLFRRWVDTRTDDPVARLTAAQVLHQHGLFDEALALLVDLEAPSPLRQPIDAEIERLRRVTLTP